MNRKMFYFVSEKDLDGVTLIPRVPDNRLIRQGYEDGKTKRVCASINVSGALAGLSKPLEGKTLYVHTFTSDKYRKPTEDEVPDVNISNEYWILEPVTLIKRYKVYVPSAIDIPIRYKVNDGKVFDAYLFNYIKVD